MRMFKLTGKTNGCQGKSGFALIEVLIAVFVLAVGILGAGAMQTIGLQSNQGAYMRSQAMLLAGDMVDRIRANRSARASYFGIDTNSPTVQAMTKPVCISSGTGCAPANVAQADIVEWTTNIETAGILPEGRGEIASVVGAGDNVRVTVSWGETDWVAGVRSSATRTYTIVAAINPGDH